MNVVTNIDMTKNELRNAVVHLLAGAPASPSQGQIYYNSTSKFLAVYSGTSWVILGRLDQMSAAADVSLSNFKITNLADPVADQDAVNLRTIQGLIQGQAWKDEVRVATTANITLSGTQTIDGVALAAGDRVLVKDQTTPTQNGIYLVAAAAWTRALDADTDGDLRQATVLASSGSVNADTGWTLITDPPLVVGTTALTFVKIFGGAPSVGVRKFAADIGDGTATQIPVVHNLGTTDVVTQVFDKLTPASRVITEIRVIDLNTVRIEFAVAPTAAQYRAVVTG